MSVEEFEKIEEINIEICEYTQYLEDCNEYAESFINSDCTFD